MERPLNPTPRFTLTPQRMRMIVEAFKDTLELGLSKHGQVVVRPPRLQRRVGHWSQTAR